MAAVGSGGGGVAAAVGGVGGIGAQGRRALLASGRMPRKGPCRGRGGRARQGPCRGEPHRLLVLYVSILALPWAVFVVPTPPSALLSVVVGAAPTSRAL